MKSKHLLTRVSPSWSVRGLTDRFFGWFNSKHHHHEINFVPLVWLTDSRLADCLDDWFSSDHYSPCLMVGWLGYYFSHVPAKFIIKATNLNIYSKNYTIQWCILRDPTHERPSRRATATDFSGSRSVVGNCWRFSRSFSTTSADCQCAHAQWSQLSLFKIFVSFVRLLPAATYTWGINLNQPTELWPNVEFVLSPILKSSRNYMVLMVHLALEWVVWV